MSPLSYMPVVFLKKSVLVVSFYNVDLSSCYFTIRFKLAFLITRFKVSILGKNFISVAVATKAGVQSGLASQGERSAGWFWAGRRRPWPLVGVMFLKGCRMRMLLVTGYSVVMGMAFLVKTSCIRVSLPRELHNITDGTWWPCRNLRQCTATFVGEFRSYLSQLASCQQRLPSWKQPRASFLEVWAITGLF